MIEGDISRENEFNKFSHQMGIDISFKFLMFKFNICFMVNQIKNVIDNINQLCIRDHVILIMYIDGELVEKLIGKSDKFEFLDENKIPIFGLYLYDDKLYYHDDTNQSIKDKKRQIVIYLRETLRYGYGVVEPLTKTQDILDAFSPNYELMIDDFIRGDNLDTKQQKILEIFRYMILRKK
jgi:hypothetical protein